METESTETHWSQLLKPLKELSENWSVDIAGELESFLEKLELLPEEAKLRFADAAVLVQQSADVYGRKVEHLYQLVYRTLETLLLKHGAVAADQSKRKGKRSAELGESSDDEFALSVPEAVIRGMNPASGAVRGALTMTAYRTYLEAEREFRDIADLVPFAKSETIDLEDFEDEGFNEAESELERQENRTLEKQVHSAACSVERHTITVATPGTPGWRAPTQRDSGGAALLPSASITAAPWNMISAIPASTESDPLDLEQLWLKWSRIHGRSGALLIGIAPEELIFDESEGSDSGGTRKPDEKPASPTDADVVGPDMDWSFGAAMVNLSPGAIPQPAVGMQGDPNLLEKRRRRQKPRKIPADPWKQLDMFPNVTNSGTLENLGSRGQHRPFRKGLSFAIRSSVPRTSTFEEFKKWQYLRKLVPGASFDNHALGMFSSDATQLIRRGDSEWARSWMHIIFRGSLFPPLDASVQAHRRPKRHRGTHRLGVAELSASDDESTSTGTDDDLSQDGDRPEASGSLTGNPDNKPNDILFNWNEARDPAVGTNDADAALPEIGNLDTFDGSDGLFAGEAHLSDANPEALVETFEQICRRYLEETATAWRRVQEERTLYQRVESWHTALRPKLLAAEQRAVFSVPVYFERVGERVRPYRTSTEPIPINVVCADFDRVETCRLFVALLHWAAETGLRLEAATTRRSVSQPAACDPHLYSAV